MPLVFMNPPDVVPTTGLVEYMLNFDFDRDAPRIFRRNVGIYRESPMQFMSANDTDLARYRGEGSIEDAANFECVRSHSMQACPDQH